VKREHLTKTRMAVKLIYLFLFLYIALLISGIYKLYDPWNILLYLRLRSFSFLLEKYQIFWI